jgi:hypothetical protein
VHTLTLYVLYVLAGNTCGPVSWVIGVILFLFFGPFAFFVFCCPCDTQPEQARYTCSLSHSFWLAFRKEYPHPTPTACVYTHRRGICPMRLPTGRSRSQCTAERLNASGPKWTLLAQDSTTVRSWLYSPVSYH